MVAAAVSSVSCCSWCESVAQGRALAMAPIGEATLRFVPLPFLAHSTCPCQLVGSPRRRWRPQWRVAFGATLALVLASALALALAPALASALAFLRHVLQVGVLPLHEV